MKIEQDKLNLQTTGADASGRPAGVKAGAAGADRAPGGSRGDALTLSPEVRALHAAAEAAAAAPQVRTDLVARMRELLDRGQIGNDPVRLANAVLDGAIERR
jgi:flagellar biosynthesis anti-sigma factor FlgM